MTVTCHPPFALIPLARPELTPLAVLHAPRISGAVFMPFTLNDSFDDFAREHRLPDCAVSFLSRAGTWSARASKSGFVPSTMHAEFSDDPDQAVRVLLAAGAVRRVKAGVRISESPCWTLVNAKDVTRDAEREDAEAERKRGLERTRKQRQRDRERAEREVRMSAGVTGMSRETSTDVTPENPRIPKKQQVSSTNVPRDISVTSRGTPQIDRSDQDQSIGVSRIDAYARDLHLLRLAAGEFGKKVGRIIGDAEAEAVIRTLARRADEAGTVIRDPESYFRTSIRRATDPERLLDGDAPPLREILAESLTDANSDAHPFIEGEDGNCATCRTPQKNRIRHPEPESESRPA